MTKWFKKEISCNTLINYYSNHPQHILKNTAKNYIDKAIRVTSSQYTKEIRNKVTNILKENLFPETIINQLWNACYQKYQHEYKENLINKPTDELIDKTSKPGINLYPQPFQSTPNSNKKPNNLITTYFKPINNVNSFDINNTHDISHKNSPAQTKVDNTINKKYLTIPYLNKASVRLKDYLKNNIPDKLTITLKPINKTQSKIYTNTKDKIDKLKNTNIIYKIPCSDCNLSYIGQTKQYLKDRIKQHSSNCNSTRKEQNNKTALSTHNIEQKHIFNFDDTSILHKEDNIYKRNIIEAVYILKNINSVVNFRSDADGISHFYNNIIDKL